MFCWCLHFFRLFLSFSRRLYLVHFASTATSETIKICNNIVALLVHNVKISYNKRVRCTTRERERKRFYYHHRTEKCPTSTQNGKHCTRTKRTCYLCVYFFKVRQIMAKLCILGTYFALEKILCVKPQE